MKTKNPYFFETIDNIISFDLNPLVVSAAGPNVDFNGLVARFNLELRNLQTEFKQQFFSISSEDKGAALVGKHNDAVVLLINRVYSFMQHEDTGRLGLTAPLQEVLSGLHLLYDFFRQNYTRLLTSDLLMPVTELLEVRGMILQKREAILSKLLENSNPQEACDIVMDVLDEFCTRVAAGEVMQIKEADYYKMIVDNIENYGGQETALSSCPSLHELLLFWNLNSKMCIRYFSLGMELYMNNMGSIDERLEYMREQLKKVNVLPQFPGYIYNSEYPSLKVYFTDFISNEIAYLENKKIGFLPNEDYKQEKDKAAMFKVICALSADQISLFLRAANDMKVIVSRSVTALFNAIVPFISTERTADLSPGNMRVKSYQGEDRDKEILISKMEEMIWLIRDY
ncbi:hypothetical protein [Chitinophaga sp. CF418]|uniref:hypothetical protein n=1 Tax=Chitinophaga sp. CF418 TaxID=1855287 RepID=UPI00091114DD|nr:hypothetical protein [Chitinophaga sp. CF418]SHN45401.1 hypothetical protein SAMN05216311_12034 [Chitinophaga sp. CF418]